MFKNLRSALSFGVTCAFVWLAGFGSANAGFIHGRIDPAFNASGMLAGLVWTADIQFDVGPECLVPGFDGMCSSVSAYSLAGTLTFNSHTIPINFAQTIPVPIDLDVNASGTVIGIGTPVIGPGDWTFPDSVGGNGWAWVQFLLPIVGDNPKPASGQLFLQSCDTIGVPETDPECDPNFDNVVGSTVPALVTITQVPEPGSLLLVFGALSAGWFVRRRRQRR